MVIQGRMAAGSAGTGGKMPKTLHKAGIWAPHDFAC